MIRICFAAVLLALAWLLSAPPAAAAPVLRDMVVVESDSLRLGDLFDGLGDKADIVIGPAPKIGRSLIYDALRLAKLARQYGLQWYPASQSSYVTVERAGRVISVSEIEDALRTEVRDYLAKHGAGRKVRVSVDNRHVPLYAPPRARTGVQVRSLWMDPAGERFTATVAASDAASADIAKVSGRTYEVTSVPVLTRRVGSDEVVSAGDLRFREMRSDQIDADVITDADAVIGMSPRRQAIEDTPLKASDFRPPTVVAKGSLVSIVLETPYMLLTAQGRAAEDGAMGEVIRVLNTQSNVTVDAVIEGPSRVVVRMPASRTRADAGKQIRGGR